MTQQERQKRSKEKIYQAALDEFGAYGYDAVNMERICGRHGISKGMMYHYYANKDELFLLCVARNFAELKAYLEQNLQQAEGQNTLQTIRDHLMMRERFFQRHGKQRKVFEAAMFRPPGHLREQIWQLHAPIREINQQFLKRLVARMPLRPGLDPEKVARYLGSIEYSLPYYQQGAAGQSLHDMLETVGEVLDMALFGVLRQADVSPPVCAG